MITPVNHTQQNNSGGAIFAPPFFTRNDYMNETWFYLLFTCIFTMIYLSAISYILFFCIISNAVVNKTPKHSDKDKRSIIFKGVSLVVMTVMLILFGFSPEFFKGCILLLILLYASVCDMQTHEVKDFVSILILITAFIGIDFEKLPFMILSGCAVFGILFLCAMLSDKPIGGADIKFSGACAFLLGLKGGIAGLLIGLLCAVVCNLIFNRKSKDKAFPLIPYLSAGYMATYIALSVLSKTVN